MKERFSKLIENYVADKHIPYMEAVIAICNQNKIELEDVKKMLTPHIKNKIEAEAQSLNYLPKVGTLPIE